MAETIEKDGEEITVYTQQEVDTAKEAAIKEAIGAKEARIAELERLNAERAENFTAYSKMTEEEKKAYDANTVNLLKRDEVREKGKKAGESSHKEKDAGKDHVADAPAHLFIGWVPQVDGCREG